MVFMTLLFIALLVLMMSLLPHVHYNFVRLSAVFNDVLVNATAVVIILRGLPFVKIQITNNRFA